MYSSPARLPEPSSSQVFHPVPFPLWFTRLFIRSRTTNHTPLPYPRILVAKTNTGAMQRAIAMQKEEPNYLDKERSRNFREPQMRAFGGLSEKSL